MELDGRIAGGSLGSIAAFDHEHSAVKQYWDDSSGKSLNPNLVKEARPEDGRVQQAWGIHEGSGPAVLG